MYGSGCSQVSTQWLISTNTPPADYAAHGYWQQVLPQEADPAKRVRGETLFIHFLRPT